jgi:predicted signal transduction protein with EAL and GGDEF domain
VLPDLHHALDISIVDRAIIAIEQRHRNRQPVARFDADLCGKPASNLSLMTEMMRALEGGGFELHYQPKRDLRSGTMIGVEALVRRSHPQRGLLAPEAFLPLAEETGRIGSLTEWVLKRGVEDQRRLLQLGHSLSVSVNLSGRLIDDEDFTRTALRIRRPRKRQDHPRGDRTGNPAIRESRVRRWRPAGGQASEFRLMTMAPGCPRLVI